MVPFFRGEGTAILEVRADISFAIDICYPSMAPYNESETGRVLESRPLSYVAFVVLSLAASQKRMRQDFSTITLTEQGQREIRSSRVRLPLLMPSWNHILASITTLALRPP